MALTRTTQQQDEVTVQLPFGEAFRSVVEALKKVGSVQTTQEKFGRVVGRVGSGFLNMNKADVTIQVEAIDQGKSKIILKATSQEGLISQNSGAKAITRLLEAM